MPYVFELMGNAILSDNEKTPIKSAGYFIFFNRSATN